MNGRERRHVTRKYGPPGSDFRFDLGMARSGANVCLACFLLFARFSPTRPELQPSRHRTSGPRHGGWGGGRQSKKYTPMLRISVDAPDPEEEKAHQELLANTTELRERIATLVFEQELGDALTLVYQAVDRL